MLPDILPYFYFKGRFKQNVSGTYTKGCLDARRMRAIYNVYQSMSSALTNSPDCDITKVKSYNNTKNRKQVHKKLLAFIDHSSLVSNSISVLNKKCNSNSLSNIYVKYGYICSSVINTVIFLDKTEILGEFRN